MPAIDSWMHQPAAQAVGWALLQFVWQGAAVGALTALALAALKRSASDIRYVVSAIGLALMLTLPIVTGAQKYQVLADAASTAAPATDTFQSRADGVGPPAEVASRGTASPAGAANATVTPPARVAAAQPSGFLARLRSLRLEGFLPVLMPVWLVGVSLLSVRLFTGWLWVQRLRTRGVSNADETLRAMTVRLSRRLHIRRAVTLLESRLVEVPTVIGFIKPVVLLPASALAGLTPHQIEAILAHELAHIRRHDYLVNLLQTLVETVLFYHPAVWWLSRRIRIERENCCDDLAVSLCGDPVAYATALADLEALRTSGPTPERHIAMAATGGVLLQRVRRLLGAPRVALGTRPGMARRHRGADADRMRRLLRGGSASGARSAADAGGRIQQARTAGDRPRRPRGDPSTHPRGRESLPRRDPRRPTAASRSGRRDAPDGPDRRGADRRGCRAACAGRRVAGARRARRARRGRRRRGAVARRSRSCRIPLRPGRSRSRPLRRCRRRRWSPGARSRSRSARPIPSRVAAGPSPTTATSWK
jgi:beta-lactamase regulating signal transducer with metallopeptidase domain